MQNGNDGKMTSRGPAKRQTIASKPCRFALATWRSGGGGGGPQSTTLSQLLGCRAGRDLLLALGFCVWLTSILSARAEIDVRRDAAVNAIEKVMPSVVNISTETIIAVRDPLDELFREFFGPYYRQRPPNAQKSVGSGVIIDEEGYVLTNLHVVRRADRIVVTLADGREFEARPLTGTQHTDVALLKIITKKNEKFTAVRFAADDDLLLGETVLALGNPFGLGGSVTRGILSSKARRPPLENESLDVEDWLQTDAAINPGNSGGPLINLRGELIGINVAVFREAQGIGFAIPVKRVSEALSQIFTPETIRGLWFGARFESETNHLSVASVEPSSPADQAGLRVGDRILAVNDKTPKSLFDLNRELISADAKSEIRLLVQRGADRKPLKAQLVPEKEVFNAALIRRKTGMTLQELSPELAAEMGVDPVAGLLVADVEKNGPAAEVGIRPGYFVQAIDGRAVSELTGAAKILHAKRAGERVQLSLIVQRQRGAFLVPYSASARLRLR